MEEDEVDDHSGTSALEKGAAEEGKENDKEEEGGITFKVRAASTPDERGDRKPTGSTLSAVKAPKGAVSSHPASQSPQPIPEGCATVVEPQSQTGPSTSTGVSSSGKCFRNFSLNI